jgi:hypothetical protein
MTSRGESAVTMRTKWRGSVRYAPVSNVAVSVPWVTAAARLQLAIDSSQGMRSEGTERMASRALVER